MYKEEFHLYTAVEAEKKLGKKYFYRQKIYRLGDKKAIPTFNRKGEICFIGSQILTGFLKELELKIEGRFPTLDFSKLRVFYDTVNDKRIVVDGIYGKGVSVNTDQETEEDLLLKIRHIVEWMSSNDLSVEEELNEEVENNIHEQLKEKSQGVELSTEVLPEEIVWIKIDTGLIKGVQIKSYILISLSSVAQFIGIRTDNFIEWLSQTNFKETVLSAHYKQIQRPEISVPWKKGIVRGLTPFVPFELLPEIIVSLKHSGRKPAYKEKTEMLYNLAKSVLSAVGLAMSGNKDQASQVLARVGEGLGLTVADQIIGIFKQYESRDYQVRTNKEFNSKIKEIGEDYAVTTGRLTFGVTGRRVGHWMMLGKQKKLLSKHRTSSREIMRHVAPEDGVGMTFAERHFIKEPVLNEAINTGQKGKDFYLRLKNVGLLDD